MELHLDQLELHWGQPAQHWGQQVLPVPPDSAQAVIVGRMAQMAGAGCSSHEVASAIAAVAVRVAGMASAGCASHGAEVVLGSPMTFYF